MANKTVLDFLAVTSTDPADVLYIIRGTGAGRDKKITWANLTANLLDKTVTSAQTVVGPVSIVPTSAAVALSLTAKNNFRALAAECSHNNTTGSPPVISIKQTTSGDMGPGFGAAIRYQIRDDAGVDNAIADLRASRDDADNSGKVEIQVANAGVMATRLTVDKTGAGVFTGALTVGALGTFTVTDTATNTAVTAMLLKHKTTADMVDNFGVALAFVINDSANVDNTIGKIQALRNSIDTDANLDFITKGAGVDLVQFTVRSDGTCTQRANPATALFSTALATTQFVGRPTGDIIHVSSTSTITPEHGRVYNMNQAYPSNMTMTLSGTAPIGTVCYVIAQPNTQILRTLDALSSGFYNQRLVYNYPTAEGPQLVTCTRFALGWLVQGA